ncbi:MFS transporter, partial [Roseomonas sp. TAS13]|uniref:MFS transporter n=1 Tax=Roseomonas sp. TAS13 TaxID=1926319 RepID=UPI0011150942
MTLTAVSPAVPRRTVWALGLSQLIAWGVSYYLIGVLGERIATDLGWGMARVQGGFALSLLVMGLVSPLAGRMMDRQGGRRVMGLGSVLLALGCLGLALAREVVGYYAAWAVLGLAMRLTLYDAAFAALARIGGTGARRAMSQITLLGGLASTVFWPLGHLLAEHLGWRGACLAYAGAALLTLPLHLLIPNGRAGPFRAGPDAPAA